MITFSDQTLDAMGFRELRAGEAIAAVFYEIVILKISGLHSNMESALKSGAETGEGRIDYVVGNELNQLSRILTGDDLFENEEDWLKEKGTSPPFVMLLFGPTAESVITSGRVDDRQDALVTYGCFSEVIANLKGDYDKIRPRVISAMTLGAQRLHGAAKVEEVERRTFGTTRDGRRIFDSYFKFSATASVIQKVDPSHLCSTISESIEKSPLVSPKYLQLFELGLSSTDPLNRFLYFFLCIEIETNVCFDRLRKTPNLGSLGVTEKTCEILGSSIFKIRHERNFTEVEKFSWCATLAWPQVGMVDFNEFMRLKDIRNDILHGRVPAPKDCDSVAAMRLAAKLFPH